MYTTLISPQTVAEHINDRNWVIFDCRFNLLAPQEGRISYYQGHIPNARYVDLNEDMSSPTTTTSGRHPLPDPQVLAKKLGDWGVDENTQVIVYDADSGMLAARLWWLLRWLGHSKVALLEGGLNCWQQEAHPITPELPKITLRQFTPNLDNRLWIDTAVVESFVAANGLLLDARTPERFSGEQEMIDPVGGHIPGARNVPCIENVDGQQRFLPSEQLRARFDSILQGRPAQEVVCMCGSGVTACHNLLAMELAGLPGARLYVGSWSEWITSDSRPVATGSE